MEDHKEVFEIVSGNFDIVPHNVLSMNQVRDLLAVRVREMLDKNVEKLVSTVYRIDVSERVRDEKFNLS